MATKPGMWYHFPWEGMGEYKYVLLAPIVAHHFYSGWSNPDQARFDNHMVIIVLLRYFQMWLWQFLSRFDATSKNTKIQRKGIEFEQLDRERHWDDYIILQALGSSVLHRFMIGLHDLPVMNWTGLWQMALVHIGPIEFIYYLFHRALHHEFLWDRYHSHHHSSFVTEPISGTVHPFMEHLGYTFLFSLAVAIPYLLGTASIALFYIYALWFDGANALGHCNFEFFPRIFTKAPLKYLWYTPSYHSLHHSKVHTNYCLFMPIYDYMFGTVCPATEKTYIEAMAQRNIPQPSATFLAHGGTLTHVFQIPFISKTVGAEKYKERWYLYPLYPVLYLGLVPLLRLFGVPFKNADCMYKKAKGESMLLEQWGVPAFAYQYLGGKNDQKRIAKLVEDAVVKADKEGLSVIGLGAFNKAEWLNGGGKDVVKNLPKLGVRVVHGNTLTAATVVHSVPPDVHEVMLVGCTSKVGSAVTTVLALKGIRVLMVTQSEERFLQVQAQVKAADPEGQAADNLVKCSSVAEGSNCTTWLVGKWLSAKDQAHAPKGCLMLYFCFPPPQFVRADVTYLNIGCLSVDTNRVEGLGNCTADLDRGVFHACHVGTIVHALEGWKHHETGEVDVAQMEVTWEAAQRYGFSLVPEVARVVRAGSWDTRSNSSTESPKATPTMTVEEVKEAVRDGQSLVIIEDWVHDVSEFLYEHPGGETILTKYFGKDATSAFNGARYNHSRAARAILAKLRIAKVSRSFETRPDTVLQGGYSR